MEAILVKFNDSIQVEWEDGTISRLNLNGQRVKIIDREGDNIYWCEPIGFPRKGKFSINKSNLEIIRER